MKKKLEISLSFFVPFLIASLLILSGGKAIASDMEIKDYLPKTTPVAVPLQNGSILTVADGVSTSDYDVNTLTIRNRVSLRIMEEQYISYSFVAHVQVNIDYTNIDGTVGHFYNEYLRVSYDPARGTQYDAEQYHSFTGAKSVTVTVIDIQATPSSGTAFLRLQNTQNSSRDYFFNIATVPTSLSARSVVPQVTNQRSDELLISWAPAPPAPATHFDLEWAWIDEEVKSRYQDAGSNFVAEAVFNKNATRTTLPIDKNSYQIPVLYSGQGYIFYRVRFAQLKTSSGRLEGQWTSGLNYFQISNGHEESFNWQATTSYAEDGKRKSVVTYFDGTLRSRQTVTKDNSITQKYVSPSGSNEEASTTVVAETKYDYQGRPVIQVLPAPTLSTIIEYSRNFNVVKNSSGGIPLGFDKSLYDIATACDQSAPPLDNSTGAANYYSPQNPKANQGVDRFIPDAGGYPFTETRFDDVNIGQVASQSGVGPVHRIGSGHETKYYYDHPAQAELDGMFGTDAGLAQHYFKNMVQDANGQFSVSYTDMYGHTVATALAGATPPSLQALPSNNTQAQQQLTKSLLTSNSIRGREIESVASIVVPTSTTAQFNYSLTPETLRLMNCSNAEICYDCVYDLEITITNGCDNKGLQSNGSNYIAGRGYVRTETNITQAGYNTPGYNRCSPQGFNRNFTVSFTEAGEYIITKRLILKGEAQDSYRNLFLQNNTCKTVEQYKNEFLTILNSQSSSCPVTCNQCLKALGKENEYIDKTILQSGLTSTPELVAQLTATYNQLLEECNQLCGRPTYPDEITSIRQQMLADMSPPNGQYARMNRSSMAATPAIYDADGQRLSDDNSDLDEINKRLPAIDYTRRPYNIFNTNYSILNPLTFLLYPSYQLRWDQITSSGNFYKDASGSIDQDIHPGNTYVQLNSTNPENFNTLFKDSWAEALLRYHPEYPRLQYVENNPSILAAYRFNDELKRTDEFHEAFLNGWLIDVDNYAILGVDPFFTGLGNDQLPGMRNICNNYITDASGTHDMWYAAISSIYCNSIGTSCSGMPLLSDLLDEARFCSADRDKVWQAYRALYLTERSKFLMGLVRKQILPPIITTINTASNHYVERFRDPSVPPAPFTNAQINDPVFIGGQIVEQQRQIVDGYEVKWRQQLATITCLTPSQVNDIIIDMRSICLSTFDDSHPMGASSRNAGAPLSFVDAIRNRLPGGTYTATCHPYVIDWPKPYDNPQAISIEVISETPDPCVCTRLTTLKNEAASLNYNQSCLAAYLKDYYQADITQPEIDRLLQACDGSSGCRTIDPPVRLPAILQCEVQPSAECASCGLIDEYKSTFYSNFPGFGATPYLEPDSDEERAANQLFATYMNHLLGFNKTWEEYIIFLKQCTAAQNGFTTINNSPSQTNVTITCPSDPQLRLCRGTVQPIFTVDNPDPCDDNATLALENATYQYTLTQIRLKDEFDSKYQDKCLQAANMESFTATYQLNQYHYTLYYYDQAGNLVQTVPPAGADIRLNDNGGSGSVFLNAVKAARAAGSVKIPCHALITRYLYNSLNQVVIQKTPDAGESHFYYDYLGRLAASQNAKQAVTGAYSYTLYEEVLSRITEVGERVGGSPITRAIARDYAQLNSWLVGGTHQQVTRTVYDKEGPGLQGSPTFLTAQNLRNRVSYTYVSDQPASDGSMLPYRAATFYSYDIHGNVDVVLQDFREGMMQAAGNGYKRIEYKYDLVSGKVNEVAYQPGRADAFYHRYQYNAENRLTGAETSRDQLLWQHDATYTYYRHGPLARTQLGQLNVQGIDYAYTLQGWLKGVNSSEISSGARAYYDMGGDDGSSISKTAKDVYSFSLHYYDGGGRQDYLPIGGSTTPNPFSSLQAASATTVYPLYNGNIAAMGVNIDFAVGGGGQGIGIATPLLYAYRYDQLNRLVDMQAHKGLSGNQWNPIPLPDQDYKEHITYDANGNILSYDRNGTTTAYGSPSAGHGMEMDRLRYAYNYTTLPADCNSRVVLTNNQLRHIKDDMSDDGRYNEDIDNQVDDNYAYDAIGNLVRDTKGNNDVIRWTLYGKIASIDKTDGTRVYYTYDASGNRISKQVDRTALPAGIVRTTWYVRDAQGNVLSTYEKSGGSDLQQTEVHIYGSGRLGIYRCDLVVEGSGGSSPAIERFIRGRKMYELSNHLGNVLATITDKKVLVQGSTAGGTGGICTGGGIVNVLDVYTRNTALTDYQARQEINFLPEFESPVGDEWQAFIDAGAPPCDNGPGSGMPAGAYYVADLVSATDYAPFGMALVGRTYQSSNYRYSFNGKEIDKDINEGGQDYGLRIYDTKLGRFLSSDPLTMEYPWYTPYQFAGNKPIWAIDLDGGEEKVDVSRYWENQPLVDMTFVAKTGKTNAAGYTRNGVGAAKAMFQSKPEMFSPENQFEIFENNRMPVVDEQWILFNPTHSSYESNPLIHHHIDGGKDASLIPAKLHTDEYAALHPYATKAGRSGSILSGGSSFLSSSLGVVGFLSLFNTKNPDSWINAFGPIGDPEDNIGKVLPAPGEDYMHYYAVVDQVKVTTSVRKNENGEITKSWISKRIINSTYYSSYTKDENTGQYIGVGELKKSVETWTYDEDGNRTTTDNSNIL